MTYFREWWKGIRRVRRLKGVTVRAAVREAPVALAAGRVVLIGDYNDLKWLLLGCPCRCGETLWVNLMAARNPYWLLRRDTIGAITLTPSLDVSRCRSHFWVRENRVVWV